MIARHPSHHFFGVGMIGPGWKCMHCLCEWDHADSEAPCGQPPTTEEEPTAPIDWFALNASSG